METVEQRKWLDRWYEYIKNDQRNNADTRKKKIEARLHEFTDPDMVKLYHLMNARYHLMYKDLDKASEEISNTCINTDEKYHWLNYYCYFFYGIYYYERRDFKTAIDHLTKARLFISDIPIEDTAELYYRLAAACTRTYQISKSIKLANKALEIFESRSNFNQMANCENLLGLNNYQIDQFKEALRCYHRALVDVQKTNNSLLKLRILHNMGLLYSDQKRTSKALEYLNQVYSNRDKLNETYLIIQNLYLIAFNHTLIDQMDQAIPLLEDGLKLSQKFDFKDFYYQFDLLKVKYRETERFESAYEEAIDYFKTKEWWEYIIEYGEELATHLRKKGDHRKAVAYYELAIDARNQIRKEREIDND